MRGPSTLLIDDEEGFSKSILPPLERAGVHAEWADSWGRGLALFRRGSHELVIADYNLPGSRHGLQLLASVKLLRPTSRLVLISGALNHEALERLAQTTLVDRFLVKDGKLADYLIDEGRAAESRADEQTDWSEVAKAYSSGAEIDFAVVDEIDEALRVQVEPPGR